MRDYIVSKSFLDLRASATTWVPECHNDPTKLHCDHCMNCWPKTCSGTHCDRMNRCMCERTNCLCQ